MTKWRAFWERMLSVETARFILALLALNFSAVSVGLLLTGYAAVDPNKEAVVTFALGQLFALTMVAFNRYFGRGGDETASGKANDPVHIEPESKPPIDRELPEVGFGKAD